MICSPISRFGSGMIRTTALTPFSSQSSMMFLIWSTQSVSIDSSAVKSTRSWKSHCIFRSGGAHFFGALLYCRRGNAAAVSDYKQILRLVNFDRKTDCQALLNIFLCRCHFKGSFRSRRRILSCLTRCVLHRLAQFHPCSLKTTHHYLAHPLKQLVAQGRIVVAILAEHCSIQKNCRGWFDCTRIEMPDVRWENP